MCDEALGGQKPMKYTIDVVGSDTETGSNPQRSDAKTS